MDSTPAAIRAAQRRSIRNRTPRVELSLERIVDASILIADRDGLAGISMAKVAKELGYATMALYRHIDSKEELLLHVQDAALGSPPATIASHDRWHAGLTAWVREIVAAYRRHPWTVEIPVSGPPTLPHGLEWLNAALAVMTDLPLTPIEKLSTVSLLGGYARSEVALLAIIDKDVARGPEFRTDLEYEAHLRSSADALDLPAISALFGEGDPFTIPVETDTESGDDFMVDFGLERILDGIAALCDRRGHSDA